MLISFYLQQPDLPDYLIPKMGMVFENVKEAQVFYNRYARHAGFGTKLSQHSGYNQYPYCMCQEKYQSTVSDVDRQCDKTTIRCDCKANLWVKRNGYDDTCVIVDINLEHNHRLMQTPSMLVFLHSHKSVDPSILEYVKFLQYQNVPHHTILSILYGSLGGGQYLAMHGRDLLNW
jgi:hypothetical protein